MSELAAASRLPPPAFAALAATPGRWSLEQLADGRSQRRALDQLCAEVPSLRTALGLAASVLCREGAVVVEAVPMADCALVITASAMGVASTEDNGSPGRLVWDVRPGSASSTVRSQLPDAFPLHTDSAHLQCPHAVVGLACVEPSRGGGGVSLLVPAGRVMDALRAAGREQEERLLQHPSFPFASVSEDGRPVHLRPIFSLADRRVEVRYREPLLQWGLQLSPQPLGAAYVSALDARLSARARLARRPRQARARRRARAAVAPHPTPAKSE